MAFSDAFAVQGETYPAEMQRLANSAIAPDVSGVIGVSDLLVRGLGSTGVSVDPGAAIVANTYPLANFRQSYLVSNDAADDDAIIAVPAAGSGSARTDYLIYRIYDEQYAGQTDSTGKGGGLALVSSLPTTYPFVALAKIVQPAGNTAGIQQSMVTDLRVVAAPRTKDVVIAAPGVTSDTDQVLNSAAATGEIFPAARIAVQDIDIPKWATRIQIMATAVCINYAAGANPYGDYWVEWGDTTGSSVKENVSDKYHFDSPGGSNMTISWPMAMDQAVPKKYRGVSTSMWFKARYGASGMTGTVKGTKSSGMIWHVRFLEVADSTVS